MEFTESWNQELSFHLSSKEAIFLEGDNIEVKKEDMVLQQQGVRRVDGREANSLSFWNSGADWGEEWPGIVLKCWDGHALQNLSRNSFARH